MIKIVTEVSKINLPMKPHNLFYQARDNWVKLI